MDGLDLKAKWGALPVWGWGAIVAGVALLGYYIYRGRGSSAPVSGVSGTSTGLDAMGYQTSGIKGGTGAMSNALPETNTQWLARVSRLVADTGAKSPSEVYGALYKYITGQTLTPAEKSIVDEGIRLGMSPPEGTQGVSEVTNGSRTSTGFIRNAAGGIVETFSDKTADAITYDEWVSGINKNSYRQVTDAEFNSYKIVS